MAVAINYALPVLPVMFLFGPIGVLQGIYAKYFGLSLSTIAAVILIARLFDAITDPIIGYFIDRHYARGGSPKQLVIGSCSLFIISSWFLYTPPINVSTYYFLSWLLAFYLAYTLFEIPHLAWGNNLAKGVRDKNMLYSLRSFCLMLGGLLFYGMPLLPFFSTNEITPETLKWSVGAACLMMLPLVYLSVTHTPDIPLEASRSDGLTARQNSKLVIRAIVANRPLVILLLAVFCTFFAGGMINVLLFIFVDAYLGLGNNFVLAYMISFTTSLLFIKIWYHTANCCGVQATWVLAIIVMCLGTTGVGLLSPNYSSFLSLVVSIGLIIGGSASISITAPSLLSSISDYGIWKFGTDHSAMYFSIYTLLNKTVNAFGGAAGLAIAGWYEFDPSQDLHSDSAVFGLRLSIAWLPILILSVAGVLAFRIPITSYQHAVLRRRLDSRPSCGVSRNDSTLQNVAEKS